MEKEKKKTIVPQKFQEMYIIMGGNPNYRDTENFIYNKKTMPVLGVLFVAIVTIEPNSTKTSNPIR